MQRAIIHWKCADLSDTDAHRAMLPASPLMTMAGLVSHLRWVEHLWFEVVLLGGPAESPYFAEEDDEMRVAGVPLEQILGDYQRQCARADEIIAGHSLDDVANHPEHGHGTTLRWILFHMVEESARHAGHADAIRELLDNTTGYY